MHFLLHFLSKYFSTVEFLVVKNLDPDSDSQKSLDQDSDSVYLVTKKLVAIKCPNQVKSYSMGYPPVLWIGSEAFWISVQSLYFLVCFYTQSR